MPSDGRVLLGGERRARGGGDGDLRVDARGALRAGWLLLGDAPGSLAERID